VRGGTGVRRCRELAGAAPGQVTGRGSSPGRGPGAARLPGPAGRRSPNKLPHLAMTLADVPSCRSRQQTRSATPIPTLPFASTSSLPQWTADRAEYMTGATADAARRRARLAESFSVHFRHRDKPGAMITCCYYAAVELNDLTTFLEQQTELSTPSPPTLVAARSSSRPATTPSSVSSTAWRPPRPSAPPQAIWQAMRHGRASRPMSPDLGVAQIGARGEDPPVVGLARF
jgi:hypothetical protein